MERLFDYSFESFVSPEFWNRESNYGYVCNDVDYRIYDYIHMYSILIPILAINGRFNANLSAPAASFFSLNSCIVNNHTKVDYDTNPSYCNQNCKTVLLLCIDCSSSIEKAKYDIRFLPGDTEGWLTSSD